MSHFHLNPFFYPPNVPVVVGAAMSVQAQALTTLTPNPIVASAVGTQASSVLALATSSRCEAAIQAAAAATMTLSALQAPAVFITDSRSAMTMVGAAIARGAWDARAVGLLSGVGGAIASAPVTSASSATAALVGSTSVQTLLLNHFNGTDGTWVPPTDEVPGITWSRRYQANAELDTAQQKFGTASVLLLPSTQVSAIVGAGFSSPHAGDWTIEGFFRLSSSAGTFIAFGNDGSDNYQIEADFFGSLQEFSLIIRDSLSNVFISVNGALTIAANTWYHYAVVCDSVAANYSLFFNGNRISSNSTGTDARSFDRIELQGAASGGISHWADEPRVTANVIYSGATYTVPTVEFSV